MNKIIAASCLAVAVSAFAQGFGGQQGNGKIEYSEKFADLNYAGDEKAYHTLDIYLPKETKDAYPVVIHTYGSAWSTNNMKGSADLNTICAALLKAVVRLAFGVDQRLLAGLAGDSRRVYAADGVQADYPEITRWFLGGHSLGGAVAANYLEKHGGEYDGLLLLAAYSVADLSGEQLRVLTVYGSEDGLLEMDKVESGRALQPADAGEQILPGGCHAFFGSYGAQKGDGVPQITNEQQMDQTADLVEAFCLENALDAAA